ncbi:hypothetical protein JL_174 [Bacillus phage JL]|uniref:Uncharacterized protein n=1 Tax=Bacillus phage JL TaxID=1296655 RepID=S5M8K0_9CAUD|nr:hypothetical protein AVV47_gp122 [Bacillus phage JL]AGR46843.1 hypothetical protein JL_174 [Bacillus phage JL]
MGMRIQNTIRQVWMCWLFSYVFQLAGILLVGVVWWGILDLDEYYATHPPDITIWSIKILGWVTSFILVYRLEKKEGSL